MQGLKYLHGQGPVRAGLALGRGTRGLRDCSGDNLSPSQTGGEVVPRAVCHWGVLPKFLCPLCFVLPREAVWWTGAALGVAQTRMQAQLDHLGLSDLWESTSLSLNFLVYKLRL